MEVGSLPPSFGKHIKMLAYLPQRLCIYTVADKFFISKDAATRAPRGQGGGERGSRRGPEASGGTAPWLLLPHAAAHQKR